MRRRWTTWSSATCAEMQATRLGAGIFTIDGFLSPAECAAFIARSEGLGYSSAVINTDEGERLIEDARNNDRIVFDDPQLAASFYERALPTLPADLAGWTPCGFSERFRFYRYTSEQYFKWHLDGTYRRSPTEESALTFMIYLNEDYAGGRTEFGWESVAPATGKALVFPHRLRHQGAPVVSGAKYVLRTDVMYRLAAV